MPSRLVMQIILRRDLLTDLNWPIGALLAQSAHAATAVLHIHRGHPDVKLYLEGEDGYGWEIMRKVTYEVADEATLQGLTCKLDVLDPHIPYHIWVERPENICTAVAIVPNRNPQRLRKVLQAAGCDLFK